MNYADIVIPDYCQGVLRRELPGRAGGGVGGPLTGKAAASISTCRRSQLIYQLTKLREEIETQRPRAATSFANLRRKQNVGQWVSEAEQRFVWFYEQVKPELDDLESCTCDE